MEKAWWIDISYEDKKFVIKNAFANMARDMCSIGYMLKSIRDSKEYEQDGYKDIWEFAKGEFNLSNSMASRYMSVNDKYSVGGNSLDLAARYKEYNKSQLIEMLYLDDAQRQQVTPDTTVKQIREMRRAEETDEAEDREEQIQGQIELSLSARMEPRVYGDEDVFLPEDLELINLVIARAIEGLSAADFDENGHLLDIEELNEHDTDVRYAGKAYHFLAERDDKNARVVDKKGYAEIATDSDVAIYLKNTRLERIIIRRLQEEHVLCVYVDRVKDCHQLEACHGIQCCIDCNRNHECNGRCAHVRISLATSQEKSQRVRSEQAMTDVEVDLEIDESVELYEEVQEPEIAETLVVPVDLGDDVEIEASYQEIPSLPSLKTDAERRAFIESYDTWPLWIETEQTGEKYYRFELPDEAAVVVRAYRCRLYDFNAPVDLPIEERYYEGYGKEEYYILQQGQLFYDGKMSKTSVLKYIQDAFWNH